MCANAGMASLCLIIRIIRRPVLPLCPLPWLAAPAQVKRMLHRLPQLISSTVTAHQLQLVGGLLIMVALRRHFVGTTIEEAFITTLVGPTTSESVYPQNFVCIPCEPGCRTCADESPCFVQFNIFLRAITLGIQSFCATITFMIAIAICKLRRHKVWHECNQWTKLYTILLDTKLWYNAIIILKHINYMLWSWAFMKCEALHTKTSYANCSSMQYQIAETIIYIYLKTKDYITVIQSIGETNRFIVTMSLPRISQGFIGLALSIRFIFRWLLISTARMNQN